ncbi:hypothetical protein WMY93_031270 [Mugilogobius chulae]|uniref:Uncharacterized protein n=1 Tax=Mugilogobius chulae TaxID=88201 RepID=A0AAW0MIX5_9GOBI
MRIRSKEHKIEATSQHKNLCYSKLIQTQGPKSPCCWTYVWALAKQRREPQSCSLPSLGERNTRRQGAQKKQDTSPYLHSLLSLLWSTHREKSRLPMVSSLSLPLVLSFNK